MSKSASHPTRTEATPAISRRILPASQCHRRSAARRFLSPRTLSPCRCELRQNVASTYPPSKRSQPLHLPGFPLLKVLDQFRNRVKDIAGDKPEFFADAADINPGKAHGRRTGLNLQFAPRNSLNALDDLSIAYIHPARDIIQSGLAASRDGCQERGHFAYPNVIFTGIKRRAENDTLFINRGANQGGHKIGGLPVVAIDVGEAHHARFVNHAEAE